MASEYGTFCFSHTYQMPRGTPPHTRGTGSALQNLTLPLEQEVKAHRTEGNLGTPPLFKERRGALRRLRRGGPGTALPLLLCLWALRFF